MAGAVRSASLEDLKRRLGPYGTAGQLQQTPVPAGGALFQRGWFNVVEAAPTGIAAQCRFWDCAATAQGGDWTVGTKLARTQDGRYVVEHVVRGQWSPGEVDRIMQQTALADGRAVRIREEQEPGSAGKTVIAARTQWLAGFDYRGRPATGEKQTRWRPFAAQAEAGNVLVVRGAWINAWLDELTLAPVGSHDDQLDSAAGAFEDLALQPTNTVTPRRLSGL